MSLFGFDLGSVVQTVGGNLASNANNALSNLYQQGVGKLAGAIGPLGNEINSVSPNSWLAKANARPDPHLTFDWAVVLPNDIAMLDNYVEEINVPITQWNVGAPIFRGGQRIFIPESFDTDSITMTVYEDIKGTATSLLMNWQSKVGNTGTGLVNYPSDYKRKLSVVMQDQNQNTILTFVFYGCWLPKFEGYSFQSSTSGRTVVQANITVDGMTIMLPNGGIQNSYGNIGSMINGLSTILSGGAKQLLSFG